MLASKHNFVKGNNFCQVSISDNGHFTIFPMKSQDEFETSSHCFCEEVGVLVDLISDGFSTQDKSSLKQLFYQVGVTLNALERFTPWLIVLKSTWTTQGSYK